MDVHDFSKAILDDATMTLDDVELLHTVLRAKEQRILRATPLRVGDRIALRNIRPKYLNGQTGRIKGRANTKIEVELDNQVGRYGKVVRVARACIQKLEVQDESD